MATPRWCLASRRPTSVSRSAASGTCSIANSAARAEAPGHARRARQRRTADWVRAVLGWTVEVVKRPQRWVWLPEGAEPPPMPTGFPVLKRRWVGERTFAWLGRYRRLSKDYEVLPASEEAWTCLASTNLLVHRLAR